MLIGNGRASTNAQNFDPKKSADLGLQIIESLTRGDLSGEFVIERQGNQTVASITFPKR